MRTRLRALALVVASLLVLPWVFMAHARAESPAADYERALELIHAYNGSGDELDRAMALADALGRSHPTSGYYETLYAELGSTWRLDQDGQPSEIRDRILAFCDAALRHNPRLAQAHVAKARVFVRTALYGLANASIDAALSIDPTLSGALFMRAEVLRRSGKPTDAEAQYMKFIESTPSSSRKANGYFWIGRTYQDAAWYDPSNREAFTAKARQAFEAMIKVEPAGAWRLVSFAGFLNDNADFDAAERYSSQALGEMDFPMARYHLAAARYQKVWARSARMTGPSIREELKQISGTTKVSLDQAIAFSSFSNVIRTRLLELQARSQVSQRH